MKKEILCPYPECPDKWHPSGVMFCPNTGKAIGRKQSRWPFVLNIIFLVTIILGGATYKLGWLSESELKGQLSPVFYSGTVKLQLHRDTGNADIVMDMVNLYLKNRGVQDLQIEHVGKDKIVIRGTHVSKSKPVAIEINWIPVRKSSDSVKKDVDIKNKRDESAEKLRRDVSYKALFSLAGKYYDDGDWQEALHNVRLAENQKKTKEVNVLKNKLISIIKGQTRVVSMLNLQENLIKDFHNQIGILSVGRLSDKIKARGQVTLSIEINERGKTKVVKSTVKNLFVSPIDKKDSIAQMISERINNISFPLPQDENGKPVRVELRLSFKVLMVEGILLIDYLKL